MPLSSSGPGLGIFIPATGVQNPLGVLTEKTHRKMGLFCFVLTKANPKGTRVACKTANQRTTDVIRELVIPSPRNLIT